MTDEKKGINPATAGVVGAVIGAAAAGAAIALSDKENRKKVGKVVEELKSEGSKRLSQLKNAANKIRSKTEPSPSKSKENA